MQSGPSRRWGKEGNLPWAREVWGSAVAQKYKVDQNAPFRKKIIFFLQRGPRKCLGAPQEYFPGPRCSSRRAWIQYFRK